MADAKYQIFVSSTYEDMRIVRDDVMRVILKMGHIPIGMEMFPASDATAWELIQRTIDESDYCVVIVARRYGSVDNHGVSYTEKEYDYANAHSVPTLGFILDDRASDWRDPGESDPAQIDRLAKFKAKVQAKEVDFWKSADELQAKILLALGTAMRIGPRPGWIRAEHVAEESEKLSRLTLENAELRTRVNTTRERDYWMELLEDLRDLARTVQPVQFMGVARGWGADATARQKARDRFERLRIELLGEDSDLLARAREILELSNPFEKQVLELGDAVIERLRKKGVG